MRGRMIAGAPHLMLTMEDDRRVSYVIGWLLQGDVTPGLRIDASNLRREIQNAFADADQNPPVET